MTRNHIIALERQEPDRSWAPVLRTHAAVNKAKGAEDLEGAALQSPMTLNFDVRYCQAIADLRLNTQRYRIVYNGAPYKVTEYDDYFERHRNVRLTGVSYRG